MGFRKIRRFLIRLLEDTEDEIDVELIPPIPMPHITADATLDSIQNNHLYHLTVGHNQMSRAINAVLIRLGRNEAKTGLVLGLLLFIASIIAAPLVETAITQIIRTYF